MSAPKIITKIILISARIFGRAFVDAYKEAAINAASQQARQGSSQGTKDPISQSSGMTLEEACMILNVTKAATPKQILERYTHLFQQNDVKNGGSFYLQSKIYRAKERLDLSMQSNPKTEPTSKNPSDTTQ
ncbi:mitochondrial import inner membrane translocase subunit TIM16 [Coelomomyces lativittatus]|nr:mitochondrial import inner membrane translocase subunit TIM16 [Coelomomyces lativittatus]KAJ1509081.1 mitochondrial import inner membrane translocase subunit TIM16 [Coelomomyces lativittatus]KAJ1518132.1 mitochondrial import inner membrane translocase subunit TIM16 [Coelomomyces lativittatus]